MFSIRYFIVDVPIIAIGSVTVQRPKKKGKKSHKFSFWFNISFKINHREKHFLYFYYSRDEYVKQSKSNFMPKKTKKSRIQCDFECGQKSFMGNHESSALPKDLLIEIFKYTKPRKMLELYAYSMSVDENPFGSKHFIGSNLEWISNHFGIETVFLRKFLVKMLYFIYSPAMDQFIDEVKA